MIIYSSINKRVLDSDFSGLFHQLWQFRMPASIFGSKLKFLSKIEAKNTEINAYYGKNILNIIKKTVHKEFKRRLVLIVALSPSKNWANEIRAIDSSKLLAADCNSSRFIHIGCWIYCYFK